MLFRLAKLACNFLLLGLCLSANAQNLQDPVIERFYREAGHYFMQNYSSKEYKSASDNWGALQDSFGNMVFANGNGILTYDGTVWSMIETPTQSVIRSMAKDSAGRIYVGALEDLGYLERQTNGKLSFISLLDKIDTTLQKMGNIWTIHIIDKDVYFESETGLFVWDLKEFKFLPWTKQGVFHKSFVWNKTLYASEEGTGLLRLEGGSFKPAADGAQFKDKRIYVGIVLDSERLILGTKFDGLYSYDGFSARPIAPDASHYLRRYEVYSGQKLPEGKIAIGTKSGGVMILDANGNVLSMITEEDGLPTDNVRAMCVDKNGDLWLALYEGISHVEISNAFSLYDKRNGLQSAPSDICRYEGNLYINNPNGTFILKQSVLPWDAARFERIALPHDVSSFGFLLIDDKLLIATSNGIFELKGSTITQLTDIPAYALLRLKGDSSRILIASDRQLLSLRKSNGKWSKARGVDDVAFNNVKFNETIPGRVWITTFSQGAVLVSFVDAQGHIDYDRPMVRSFGPEEGLPEGFIKVNSVGDHESFRVGTDSKLLRFDYRAMRFYADSLFGKGFGFENNNLFPVSNALPSGEFLIKSKRNGDGIRKVFIIKPSADGYTHKTFHLSRVIESVGVITYWDKENEQVWHVGTELMVRQKLVQTKRDTSTFSAYINKIIINEDSLIYAGIGSLPTDLVIAHAESAFRFEFTSNNLVAESQNHFQYQLEGYDTHWSAWSKETIKEYSRLWEGDYKFSVRSKDFAGVISNEQSVFFRVAPPWYRTILAYVGYVCLIALVIWRLVRWRSYKLEQEKLALQREINEQTKEIRQQNALLAEQSEELRINTEQLQELDTLKSNFFVNISHEFRTPLSLIIGPLEKYIAQSDKGIKLPELQRMHRSARRLQQLINQLLDLAKLEAGQMKISEEQHDFFYFLRVIAASFESLAEIRNIQYEVRIPTGAFETLFDKEKVETILYNLLSNAFKFTPDGGMILFEVISHQDQVDIRISDNGPGIPKEAIEKIFDRFYQVDGSSSREFEGSGIGLSLVKELITLLKGRIAVESHSGVGTLFVVTLPLTGNLTAFDVSNGQSLPDVLHSEVVTGEEGPVETSIAEELILLVEDNVDLRDYLRECLEGEYKIEVAENGEVGLQKAIQLIPDLILSDMMMPRMDGFTLCTKVRTDERISHIPFILLTARTTIESKLEGLELGADDYLTKPFNLKEVLARIRNLLDQRSSLRKSYAKEITLQPKNISITSVDEKFLNHALGIMETHLGDQQFSVERFAEEMGMSRKNLLRKIKAMTDESVNEFIRNFRLKRAAQLIQGRSATVSEIAYQVGFNNLSYFSKCFKELFGVLPTEMSAQTTANL